MALFKEVFGLDLGTYKTIVFSPERGIILEEPSVVAMDNNRNILAVGKAAKEMLGKTPDLLTAVKPITGGVISDYRAAEKMVEYFLNKALGKFSIWKPDVMVSVASSMSSTERRAIMDVVLKAGAREVYIVREPVLSAVGSGVSIHEPKGRMIVNIGAGTTDVAVVSLGGVVFSKSIKTAGDKFNQSIIDMVKKNHQVIIGEKTADNIKKTIGRAISDKEINTVLIKGRDHLTGLPKEIKINSEEVTEAIEKDLKEIIKVMRDVFFETPPEISADIFDTGVTLTGGGALLDKLAEYITTQTGVKTEVAANPEKAVAKGTGVVLKHLDLYKRSVISKRA